MLALSVDTQFLHTFSRVVELGSMAAAARELNLTPATVAQRVHALEVDLGSRLIGRTGRTVKPTAAGLRVMERAPAVLREVRDLRSVASATRLPAGPLKLGTTPVGMTGMLPPILRTWTQRHEDIEIYIEPAPTTQLYTRVLHGELDAALLVHPLFELPKVWEWRLLRREKLVLVTARDLKVKDVLQTLATEPFILYDRKVVGGRLADGYLRAHGIRPRVRFELDGIDAIAKLVAEGLGISVLPDWAVIGPVDPRLRKHALPGTSPEREVGLLWLRGAMRAALAQEFHGVAQEHFSA